MESGDALTVQNGGPDTPCPVADAGTPRCPTGYGSSAQDGAGFDELNLSGNPNIGHFQKTIFRQFDTSKFSVPADECSRKLRAWNRPRPRTEQSGSFAGQDFQHLSDFPFAVPGGCIQRCEPLPMDWRQYHLPERQRAISVWTGQCSPRGAHRAAGSQISVLTYMRRAFSQSSPRSLFFRIEERSYDFDCCYARAWVRRTNRAAAIVSTCTGVPCVSTRNLCHCALLHGCQHALLGIVGEHGQVMSDLPVSVVLLGLCHRFASGRL